MGHGMVGPISRRHLQNVNDRCKFSVNVTAIKSVIGGVPFPFVALQSAQGDQFVDRRQYYKYNVNVNAKYNVILSVNWCGPLSLCGPAWGIVLGWDQLVGGSIVNTM